MGLLRGKFAKLDMRLSTTSEIRFVRLSQTRQASFIGEVTKFENFKIIDGGFWKSRWISNVRDADFK